MRAVLVLGVLLFGSLALASDCYKLEGVYKNHESGMMIRIKNRPNNSIEIIRGKNLKTGSKTIVFVDGVMREATFDHNHHLDASIGSCGNLKIYESKVEISYSVENDKVSFGTWNNTYRLLGGNNLHLSENYGNQQGEGPTYRETYFKRIHQ